MPELIADGRRGQVSAAVRINGELRSMRTAFPVDAVFPIYSVTKTLTAICVLRLADAGRVGLDDSIRRWVPDTTVPAAITLTQLLRHTSGLPDYGPLPEYHEAVRTSPDRPWTRQQFVDATLGDGVLFPPGERFSYSNIGYMLLVEVIERVTGQTFRGAIDDLIVTPLALQRTTVLAELDDLMRCVPGFGSEVTVDGESVDVRGRYHPGWCAPRLVASTLEDVTRVFDALIAGEVLEPATLDQMLALAPLTDDPTENHSAGMGVFADSESPFGRNYHHGGGGPGYTISATVYPDTPLGRVSIAVFVNSSAGPQAAACEAMVRQEIKRLLTGGHEIKS